MWFWSKTHNRTGWKCNILWNSLAVTSHCSEWIGFWIGVRFIGNGTTNCSKLHHTEVIINRDPSIKTVLFDEWIFRQSSELPPHSFIARRCPLIWTILWWLHLFQVIACFSVLLRGTSWKHHFLLFHFLWDTLRSLHSRAARVIFGHLFEIRYGFWRRLCSCSRMYQIIK